MGAANERSAKQGRRHRFRWNVGVSIVMHRVALLTALLATTPVVAQLPPAPESADPSAEKKPVLFAPERTHDLGSLIEGDVRPIEWVIENHGAAPLVIDRTQSTCGCTIVMLRDEEKTIPPGGTLTLRAEFNSTARAGKQDKKIKVFSNDPVEPELHLGFTASVEPLYTATPIKIVNLRGVRRGERVSQTIDFVAAPGRKAIESFEIESDPEGPLSFSQERFEQNQSPGVRVRMTVGDDVGLGAISTSINVRLRIDGVDRERAMPIRGQVVGSLTWTPQVVDETRTKMRSGKKLAPVTIRTTDEVPFNIVTATCDPRFNVSVEAERTVRQPTQYTVQLTVSDDAQPGPFGTELVVRTDVLDDPIIRIPVFGTIAPPVEVDPPLIMLRQDGTDLGTRRRVKLRALPQDGFDVTGITCSVDAVTAAVDEVASARYRHLRMIEVRLTGTLPKGTHEAVLTVSTTMSGAEKVDIPVVIDVPG